MSLLDQIEQDIKKAIKEKNQTDLRTLRDIKSMILIATTQKGTGGQINEEAENKLLMKAAKQREESAKIYDEQNRNDLKEKELQELNVINRYLPEQLSEEEIEEKVKTIIADTEAEDMSDMGKVMGIAMKELAGAADGKTISEVVKKLLSNN